MRTSGWLVANNFEIVFDSMSKGQALLDKAIVSDETLRDRRLWKAALVSGTLPRPQYSAASPIEDIRAYFRMKRELERLRWEMTLEGHPLWHETNSYAGWPRI